MTDPMARVKAVWPNAWVMYFEDAYCIIPRLGDDYMHRISSWLFSKEAAWQSASQHPSVAEKGEG